MNKITTLIFLWFIYTPIWAVESFPPLVPEGEQLVNSPEELIKLASNINQKSAIYSVAFSMDGKKLASGSKNSNVHIWDVYSGKEIMRFEGHTGRVNAVAFSPDGKILASGSYDKTVRLWDIYSGKEIMLFSHVYRVKSVAFNPSNTMLASGSYDNGVHLWELKSGKKLADFYRHTGKIHALVFSPNGKILASSSKDGNVILWDIASKKLLTVLKGHSSDVRTIAFSPDGKILASGSRDKNICLWNVETKKELNCFEGHLSDVRGVMFSPNGKILASVSKDISIRLWDTTIGKQMASFRGHSEDIRTLSFSPNGNILATGSLDGNILLWDMNINKLLSSMGGHVSSIFNLTFNTDANILVSSSKNAIYLWNTYTKQPLMFFNQNSFRAANFFGNKIIAFATLGNLIHLQNIYTKDIIKTFKHSDRIYDIAISPDGKTLASSSRDKSIYLWDTTNAAKKPMRLKGHSSYVTTIAFHPYENILASGSWNNTVCLWDTVSGKKLAQFNKHNSHISDVAFSFNGKLLASSSWDNTIYLWDTFTYKEVKQLKGHTKPVFVVAFSPNSKLLASGSADKTVSLWDIHTGKQIQTFNHLYGVTSLVFNKEGNQIISGDKIAHVWDITNRKLQQIFVGNQNGNWVSCNKEKCLRNDNGTFLSYMDTNNHIQALSPKKKLGELELVDVFPKLSIAPNELHYFKLKLRNIGKTPIFWTQIIHAPKDTTLLVVHPPKIIDILHPNETKELLLKLSTNSNINETNQYLNLKINSINAKPIHVDIPVIVREPFLKVQKVILQEETLIVNFQKKSYLDNLSKYQFEAQIENKENLSTITSSTVNKKSVNLTFFVPSNIYIDKYSNVSLLVKDYLNNYEWEISNISINFNQYITPSYVYLILFSLLLGIIFIVLYYLFLYRHPLVINLSKNTSDFLTLPLLQLPKIRRLLQYTNYLNTILLSNKIQESYLNNAIEFIYSPPKLRIAIFSEHLGLQYNKIRTSADEEKSLPWIFILHLTEQFMLNISRCLIAFPPNDLTAENIITQVKTASIKTQINTCLILSTDIEQRTQLIQQEKDYRNWVIPTSSDLTHLLLSSPTKTDAIFAQLIAAQVKITRISPYIIGGGVNKASMFFGRAQLLSDILNNEPCNYLLVGARQSGKTSLLKELQRRYRHHHDIQCFYLSIGANELQASLKRLNSELQLPENSDLETILKCLAHPPAGKHNILLLDEVDIVIAQESQNNYTTLHTFRSLSEEGRCHFILAGFWQLYHAISLDYQSPVKNFGKTLTISGLEPAACHELITKPMAALNMRYANEDLVEHIIEQTGRRANLISIVCSEILPQLEQRRIIEPADVEKALDSQAVETALSDWGGMVGKLARIIVYATLEQAPFTQQQLWQQLNALDITYQVEEVKQALTRLELSFIIKRDKEQYSYRVPLFCNMLKRQGTQEMLQEEIKTFFG